MHAVIHIQHDSKHSEMSPVRQLLGLFICVHCTVHNCCS